MNRYVLDISFLLIITCLSFWLRSRAQYHRRNPGGFPLPPGPKGLPIIGNVFDMPKSDEWLIMTKWGKKYGMYHYICNRLGPPKRSAGTGDIVYVQTSRQPLIFINSYDVAIELLEKRSSIYSDRPFFPMLQEL